MDTKLSLRWLLNGGASFESEDMQKSFEEQTQGAVYSSCMLVGSMAVLVPPAGTIPIMVMHSIPLTTGIAVFFLLPVLYGLILIWLANWVCACPGPCVCPHLHLSLCLSLACANPSPDACLLCTMSNPKIRLVDCLVLSPDKHVTHVPLHMGRGPS